MEMWKFIVNRMMNFDGSYFFENGKKIYYLEVINRARIIGEKLAARVGPGSTCAVLCDYSINAAIGILASWSADMVPIPMSLHYGWGVCQNILDDMLPDVLFIDFEMTNTRIDLNQLIYNMKSDVWYGETKEKIYRESLNDIAVILCTSGTTGRPKGALISNMGLQKNIVAIYSYFMIKEHNRILISRPLYHCAVFTGEFLVSLYAGLDIYFYSDKYNPLGVKKSLLDWNIEILCGTPTLFSQLAKIFIEDSAKADLKIVALSGECITRKQAQFIRSVFKHTKIFNVYGLTEASPRVSYLPPELFDEFPESVGYPLREISIGIFDDCGNELDAGTIGNIIVNSPSIMRGYYNNPELTHQKVVDIGLITGDVGYLDDGGRLYILSRADDMIIKAGLNIYPKEIENLLCGVDMFDEVLAYGVQRSQCQDIALDIVLNKEYLDVTKLTVMRVLAQYLPDHLMPCKINFVTKLNRNASGKILRPRIGAVIL